MESRKESGHHCAVKVSRDRLGGAGTAYGRASLCVLVTTALSILHRVANMLISSPERAGSGRLSSPGLCLSAGRLCRRPDDLGTLGPRGPVRDLEGPFHSKIPSL